MKKIIVFCLSVMANIAIVMAYTNVTTKIDNPNFEARFAGWINNGMTFQTSNSFTQRNGMVWMEKWVEKGSKVGNIGISQEVQNLQAGTYTLVAGASNVQQESTDIQSGAFLYAGEEEVEVSESGQYSVVFTVVNGKATIGFKTESCTGNWVCVDNFRLYYNGVVKDSINLEMQKLIDEGESILDGGETADELQTAINNAKALLTAEGDYETAAKALIRATLNYRISNATGSAPTVTTGNFVATGVTIALGRMTVKGSAAERGFCWSTEPEPTVLDNRSTRYFSNNGSIYCMEHMQPATAYYVRAYAITSGWKVGYGDVVKIATLPESNVTTWYDYSGDEQQNYRIASAVNEVYWLYHNLTNVREFNLQVHYSYGSGASGGTAECSYGGYMNVSQNVPYQQTGTILHETNHGVGVGTTNEWYNNSNLRANTSSGNWLGPRANQMVRFLENNESAVLTGDGTHMWPYGINGAHEDSYNPENTILYFANAMTTHALHQDGLICSSGVGFATPAYVFQQDDNTKYYIKCERKTMTKYLTVKAASGTLTMAEFDEANPDNFAWNITYDPATSYYTFRNVGTGQYITYNTSSSSIKTKTTSSLSSLEKFHLLPARADYEMGNFTTTGYWITTNKGAATLQAGTSTTSTKSLDFSNDGNNQRWIFISEDQLDTYNAEVARVTEERNAALEKLNALIANVQTMMQTSHVCKDEEDNITTIDKALNTVVNSVNSAKSGYTDASQVEAGIQRIQDALITFLGKVKAESVTAPLDITFLIENPTLDENTDGWNVSPTNSYGCCEYLEKRFDFNQTINLNMPIGTYELKLQAFQRPGTVTDTYAAYIAETDDVVGYVYLKATTPAVKNIWVDAQTTSLGGSTASQEGQYVPADMEAASKWFEAGYYDNSVLVTTTKAETMKLGIRCRNSSTGYWTVFDNFRLYYYGDYTIDDVVTPVGSIEVAPSIIKSPYYDLSGRKVSKPTRGLYIVNGKKIIVP